MIVLLAISSIIVINGVCILKLESIFVTSLEQLLILISVGGVTILPKGKKHQILPI